MKLSQLDDAVRFRNYRRNAQRVRDGLVGRPIDISFPYQGDRLDPFSFISAEPIRKAIDDELASFVAEQDARLRELGIDLDENP